PAHHPGGGTAQAEHAAVGIEGRAADDLGPAAHGTGEADEAGARRAGLDRHEGLEKDRNRRYETANGFAADIQRYLADEPVRACPPSAWYRFRKFARRNRRALVTVSALTLAALVGIGALAASTALVWKANQELKESVD